VFEGNVSIGLTGPQALFVIPEAAALEAALAGTAAAPGWPAGFMTPGQGPIPVIVSRRLADAPRGVGLGDEFSSSIEGYTLRYRVVEVRDGFPGLPDGRLFVIAPREWFAAQAPPARIAPVWSVVVAPGVGPEAMRQAVTAVAPTVAVTSQQETADALRTAPVTEAVRADPRRGARDGGYAAVGVAAALALAGIARTVEVARLRTLGLSGRQAVGLAVAEHGPTTVTGFVVGGALGVALFGLLRSALGLGGLVGSPADVPLALDPVPLLLIFAGMIAVLAVGLALGAVLQRRVAPASAIRGRFE
jgi:putative ABC transport system permease protein